MGSSKNKNPNLRSWDKQKRASLFVAQAKESASIFSELEPHFSECIALPEKRASLVQKETCITFSKKKTCITFSKNMHHFFPETRITNFTNRPPRFRKTVNPKSFITLAGCSERLGHQPHCISPSLRRGTLKGVPNCTKNSFVVPGHRVAKLKRAGIFTSSGTGDGSWASKYDGQARGWDN